MSNYRQLYPPPRTCRSETEIRNIFERHMKALFDQKRRMINEIAEWENDLVRQIQENVAKQKALLDQEHKNQVHYFQAKCEQFLESASIYEQRRDREEVRQLLEQCHALKYELAPFEYPEQSILFIQRQPLQIKQNSSNIEKKSTLNDQFSIQENKNVHVSTSSNQINQQLLTTEHGRSRIGDYNSKSNVDEMVEKCPACLMIFPLNMSTSERTTHVNQHFGDS